MHTENRGFAGERIDKSEADRAMSSEIKLSVRKVPRPVDRKNRMDEILFEQLWRFNPERSKSGSSWLLLTCFQKEHRGEEFKLIRTRKQVLKEQPRIHHSLSLSPLKRMRLLSLQLSLSLFLLVENWRNAKIVTREYRTKGKDLLEVGRRQPYGWNTGRGGDCQEIGPF